MNKFREFDKDTALEILNSTTPDKVKEAYGEEYELNTELIESYQKNGFVKIQRVLTGEALIYARKIIRAAVYLRKEHDKRALAEKSEYEQSFMQCGFLCFDFPAVMDLVAAKRFGGIARDLMKVDSVRLWHDQALFKEPGGRKTDVHQDCSYWPIKEPQFTTTMWLSLNGTPVNKGALYFYPGSNDINTREYVDIFKNPHKPKMLAKKDHIFVPLEEGDATFHSGLTFHGAGENRTEEMREAMTIIYLKNGSIFDAGDERNATHKSCINLINGDEIQTKYTPLIV